MIPVCHITPVKNNLLTTLLALLLTSTTALAQPNTNQPRQRISLPPGVNVLRNLEYGRVGERPMRLDLYLPENTNKTLPLIIWIHGGNGLAYGRRKRAGRPKILKVSKGSLHRDLPRLDLIKRGTRRL